jgi:EAL and modified HD-GYP domain-containing signal transduction protein
MTEAVLFARQAIYDTKHNVYAYELLFRSSTVNRADFSDGDGATAAVLLDAFSALPVEDVLDGKPAFVNFTMQLLHNPPPIHPSRLIVEVLENVPINTETIAAIVAMKQAGFGIALDDYLFESGHEELLTLADIVKIDVLHTAMPEVQALVDRLQKYSAVLLAEKVESIEMQQACIDMGFRLFQGYYHSRPILVQGRRLTASQRGALLLLTALQKADVNLFELEEIIRTDAVLALKIVRLVNSAFWGVGQEVTSVRRAIALLGIEKIRSLSMLLVLSDLECSLQPVFVSTLLRARIGQQLAEAMPKTLIDSDQQFTIGLFSNLDAYLGLELPEIINRIPLAETIKSAILAREGIGGLLLDCAIALDEAQLDTIDWQQLIHHSIDEATLRELYIDSLAWVSSVMDSLN